MAEKRPVSAAVQSELMSTFCLLSSTKDKTGFMNGTDLSRAAQALGIQLSKNAVQFYEENAGKSLNYDTFASLITTAMDQNPEWLNIDIEEQFQYFKECAMNDNASHGSHPINGEKEVAEAGFVHLWLNQMGEQIELGETETQISEFCKEYNGEMIDKDSYLRMVQTAEY